MRQFYYKKVNPLLGMRVSPPLLFGLVEVQLHPILEQIDGLIHRFVPGEVGAQGLTDNADWLKKVQYTGSATVSAFL